MKKGVLIISIFILSISFGLTAFPQSANAVWGLNVGLGFGNGGYDNYGGGYSSYGNNYGNSPYGYGYNAPYNGTWGNNAYTNPYGSYYGNYGNNNNARLNVGINFGFNNYGANTYGGYGGYSCMPTNIWGC